MGTQLKAHRDSLESYSRDLEEANRKTMLALDELSRRSHELERINHVSRTISGELNMEHLLEDVVQFTRQTTNAECAFVGLVEAGQLRVKHVEPSEVRIEPGEMDLDRNDLIRELVAGGQPVLMTDAHEKWSCSGDFARRNNFRSFVGVPITGKNEVMGVIGCFSGAHLAFTPSDTYFLELLGSLVAIALSNATLFEEIMTRDKRRASQLTVAQKLQKDRLPYNFKQNVAAMTCRLRPADELAGDFCDIFTLGRNTLVVVIGDVANKGVAASLMTFSLLSMFRNVAKTHKSPREIVKSINRSLISQIKEDGWFATAFYAKLNTKTGVLTYTSAGHETPIWYHAETGKVEMLEGAGYPLGLFSEFEYETREIQMQTGDRLILYTDGVSDAVNLSGQHFGHQALMDLTSECGKTPCAEFTETVLAKAHDFMGGCKQRDDMIVAVLELQDDPWIHKSITFKESASFITEIMDALAPYNLDTATTYGVRLSVDEAVSNAWRHGLSERDDVPFEVSYLISDDAFQLRVRDPGFGFDHESLPDPTVEENLFKSHGRGVFLIKQVMDEVEFNEAGNEITISKKFPPPAGTEESMDELTLLDSVPALRQHQESLAKARNAGARKSPARSSVE
jgi:serine phosphatase RsbU (regulator of sigma subunit)/anti-sigma regulatory factor (Ser/Thr protein kinase)